MRRVPSDLRWYLQKLTALRKSSSFLVCQKQCEGNRLLQHSVGAVGRVQRRVLHQWLSGSSQISDNQVRLDFWLCGLWSKHTLESNSMRGELRALSRLACPSAQVGLTDARATFGCRRQNQSPDDAKHVRRRPAGHGAPRLWAGPICLG